MAMNSQFSLRCVVIDHSLLSAFPRRSITPLNPHGMAANRALTVFMFATLRFRRWASRLFRRRVWAEHGLIGQREMSGSDDLDPPQQLVIEDWLPGGGGFVVVVEA
jgi:hypothetical protein